MPVVVFQQFMFNSNAAMPAALHLQEVANRGDRQATEIARREYIAAIHHVAIDTRRAMGASEEDLEEEERLQRMCDDGTDRLQANLRTDNDATDRIQANLQTDDASQANLQAATSEMSDGASQANLQAASSGQSSGSWVLDMAGTTTTVETVELSEGMDSGDDGDATPATPYSDNPLVPSDEMF